jgi:diguanylate cyclase
MAACLPSRRRFVLLLVDDGAADLDLLAELLEAGGAEEPDIVHARSLATAIGLLHDRDVDVVLANLRLPDSDGIDTFVRLQALAPGIPIVPHNGLRRQQLEEGGPARGEGVLAGGRRLADLARCLQRAVERRVLERNLLHLATHDQLTGLANRLLFEDRLRQAVARGRRSGVPGAVVFVDLDNFKHINDAHGHECGDRVLVTLAQRLRRCLRESDTIARFGGDEFLLLLEELRHPGDIEVMLDKIAAVIAQPVYHDRLPIVPSASIGVSLFPAQGHDMASLIRRADHAMYAAKRAGCGLCRYAGPEAPAFQAPGFPA